MGNSPTKNCLVLHESCLTALDRSDFASRIDLSFLDPPFNQDKAYNAWHDNLPPEEYWGWMREICAKVYALTSDGGAIYFMQREKNTEFVLQCLRDAGWTFQNLIIWKKKTSAVPGMKRFGKHYQVIAFATMVNYKNKLTLDLKSVRFSAYEIFIRFTQTRLRFSSNRRQQGRSLKTIFRLTPDDLQVGRGTRPLRLSETGTARPPGP